MAPSSPLDDLTSPFCLTGLTAKTVIISPPFVGSNYLTWKDDFLLGLSIQNKQGFIDGSIVAPSEENDPMAVPFFRNNNLLLAWILGSVSKEISSTILYERSAIAMWKVLEGRYTRVEDVRIYSLRQKIQTLQQGSTSVGTYFTKLNALWQELDSVSPTPKCSCGHCTCNLGKMINDMLIKERVFKFLMGLGEGFEAIRGQILMQCPLPNLNTVYNMVDQEEQRNEVLNTTSTETSAFYTQ